MTIIWEPTEGNHYQLQKGTDEMGNCYRISANQETVTCKTPDGFTGCSWTAQEALNVAMSDKEAARKSWTPQLAPIVFNKQDWSANTGTIFPTGPNTFLIEGIDGQWTITAGEGEGIVTMTDDNGHQYHGFKGSHNGDTTFAELGCSRQADDPRIAFAQVLYNL